MQKPQRNANSWTQKSYLIPPVQHNTSTTVKPWNQQTQHVHCKSFNNFYHCFASFLVCLHNRRKSFLSRNLVLMWPAIIKTPSDSLSWSSVPPMKAMYSSSSSLFFSVSKPRMCLWLWSQKLQKLVNHTHLHLKPQFMLTIMSTVRKIEDSVFMRYARPISVLQLLHSVKLWK